MAIHIHPDAFKRFNDLANQLLTKVVPEPKLVPVGQAFRPDIYAVANIPEQDIIGEVVEVHSVVDGAGQEVGRFFRQGNPKVGLVGDGFGALDRRWRMTSVDLTQSVHHVTNMFDLRVLEDADSIQITLGQVMRMIVCRQVDSKSAGLLLYALQIASANLRRTHFEPCFKEHVTVDLLRVPERVIGDDAWSPSDFKDSHRVAPRPPKSLVEGGRPRPPKSLVWRGRSRPRTNLCRRKNPRCPPSLA
jgi:hypothetical protein